MKRFREDIAPADEVRVWDPLVRILHWTLVAAFTLAYVSGEEWEWLHVNAGYVVAGVVVLRVLWGFVGTRHARFGDFVRSPAGVRAYIKALVQLRAARHLGHNPAGGAMIVLLLVVLALTTLLGMATYAVHDQAGPLAAWLGGLGHGWAEALGETHEVLANATLALVMVHVLGVIAESLLHGENLVRAMWTGRKRRGANAPT